MKKALRQHIRQLKATYTPEQLTQLSHQLCAKVLQLPQWRKATTVLLYNALPDEVQTQDLIQAARAEKKRILLPVVIGNDLILREDTGNYTLGPFGILEPTAPQPPKGEPLKNDSTADNILQDILNISSPRGGREGAESLLAIIPGMAFDHQNNRLGRGKGYYDRLLTNLSTNTHHLSPTTYHPSPITQLIGLCFPFQYIPTIPTEPHDIPMDLVIH